MIDGGGENHGQHRIPALVGSRRELAHVRVAGAVRSSQVMSLTHLMHEQPYHPGTINRIGAP